MKKLMKRLLNNKGLTLTEMIVALFLTSVILAIAVGMLAPVKNMMYGMKSNAHMDTISSTVDEYIRGTLQSAKSLKFVRLDNLNQVSAADRDDVKKFVDPNNNAKVIAILNTNPDSSEPPIYRLFDLGDFGKDYTQLTNHLTMAQSGTTADVIAMKEYAVFNEPFYENTSCAVEFFKSDKSRLQVASQCFRNGEMINQKHVLSFNLLNGNLTTSEGSEVFSEIEGTGEYTDVSTDQSTIEGHCYLILYTALEIV